MTSPLPATDPPVELLAEIARQHSTPAYVYDLGRVRSQAARLKSLLPGLPSALEVYYSLKANASLGLCEVLAVCGLGADVASAGELATAVEAGFPAARIFAAGPYKSPEMLEQLGSLPDAVVSVDSVSELPEGWDEGVQHVVVTAGASAPEDVVADCLQHLKTHHNATINDVTISEEHVDFPLPRELRHLAASRGQTPPETGWKPASGGA